jgi:hypothetical protein
VNVEVKSYEPSRPVLSSTGIWNVAAGDALQVFRKLRHRHVADCDHPPEDLIALISLAGRQAFLETRAVGRIGLGHLWFVRRPAQQVNQIIRPLGASKDFRYMKTTCSECGRDLKCIGYFD